MQGKRQRGGSIGDFIDRYGNRSFKGIIRLFDEANLDPAYGDFGGKGGIDRQADAGGCRHRERGEQLWPALVHVRRAAAEVWREAEEVRFVVGVVPAAFFARNLDLIDLLDVLMRAEIRREHRGPCVVGNLLDFVGIA
ncbi:hypothetical protein SDC9_136176 [bioreactor metagenome]|uniref:Uncharacterized protein n=1 Tax=bioreactor metagenome TaxID=1076179 RepID=A0A645DJ52_9ZZZZ